MEAVQIHLLEKTVLTLLVLFTLAGCQTAEPAPVSEAPQALSTETSPPPTPTHAPPTPTQNPPTATQIPSTDTPVPPTPTITFTPTPDVPSEAVSFTTQDGVDIAATLFGEGEIVVILLHMGAGGATQESWHPFARLLAEEGFAALTVDFRGRGASRGREQYNLMINDALAAVEFMQARGYNHLICVGASMGGTTCLRLSLEVELAGVVVLASTMSLGEDNKVTREDLSSLAIPKLFIYGNRDNGLVTMAMSEMHRYSKAPKELIVYDSAAHGTDLFLGPYGDDLSQQLLAFLETLR